MADRNAGEICHTCGGTGNLELIITCDKCKKLSTHVYCMKVCQFEVPEQWCCEECTGLDLLISTEAPSLNRAGMEPVPLTKAQALAQTGKVKFIPEREITFLNEKHFAKRSSDKLRKKRSLKDILGLPHHDIKNPGMTRNRVQEASQGNREKLTNLPLPEVVWKGVIEYNEHVSHTFKVQAHLAEKALQRVKDISKEMPQKISLNVKSISRYWPKAFKLEPPSDKDIGLYFFSSESERPKDKFIRLVERLYNSDRILVGRIGFLRLLLFPSQILPKYIQCIDGEPYFWGMLQRYKKKTSNQEIARAEIVDQPSGSSQVKSSEMDVDMEIDMIGGVELSTTPTAKCASQPNPRTPPGFDMARLGISPGSQLSFSEL